MPVLLIAKASFRQLPAGQVPGKSTLVNNPPASTNAWAGLLLFTRPTRSPALLIPETSVKEMGSFCQGPSMVANENVVPKQLAGTVASRPVSINERAIRPA